MVESVPKLAVVGCGKIAERYLKYLKNRKDCILEIAFEKDEKRGEEIASRYSFKKFSNDYRENTGKFDCAIVCLPNNIHYKVSKYYLSRGKHVLCEKPIAFKYEEAKELISISNSKRIKLCAAHVRRFYWPVRKIREIIVSGRLGCVKRIDWKEGSVFSWPSKSNFYFKKELSGGGVLIDIGTHVIDVINHWLGDSPKNIVYEDDNYGGVEAESKVILEYHNNIQIKVGLCRLSNFRNTVRIEMEKGKIEYDLRRPNKLRIKGEEEEYCLNDKGGNDSIRSFIKMITSFIASVSDNKEFPIKTEDVAETTKIIEECYRRRNKISYKWL